MISYANLNLDHAYLLTFQSSRVGESREGDFALATFSDVKSYKMNANELKKIHGPCEFLNCVSILLQESQLRAFI